MAGSQLEKRSSNAVDPHEEPSAEWGWHGGFPLATRIAGTVVALAMFAFLIGNHTGLTADLFLIGIGSTMIAALIWDSIRRRTSWRR